jgi:hypothetical protein
MSSKDPKYRVRVLVPCYKEDVEVLRKTLTRAVRALHEGAACISEVRHCMLLLNLNGSRRAWGCCATDSPTLSWWRISEQHVC